MSKNNVDMVDVEQINASIKNLPNDDQSNYISDGYHTFGELYDHRIKLYLALIGSIINAIEYGDTSFTPWWSKFHDDGTRYPGWIIVGITNRMTGENITYHLPESEIKTMSTVFNITELALAPPHDGHTSNDVLERLTSWFINN